MLIRKLFVAVIALLGLHGAQAYDFTTSYSYSTASRLTGAVFTTGNNVIYCYDPNGNRLTINNGTAAASIGFSSATLSVVENRSFVTIPVVRTGNLATSASVNYATANGTATSGADYGAVSGTLTWAPNDACAKFITISLVNDLAQEPDETFTISLSSAIGAPLASITSTTVTILNDDSSGVLQISGGQTVSEAVGSVSLTVNRTGGAGGIVSVSYASANVTATAGADYTAVSGTLTWGNGDVAPKLIVIPILEDRIYESDETLTVSLSNPVGGATLGATVTAIVTIQDNDCVNLLVTQPIAWNVDVSGSLQSTDGCGVKGRGYYTDEYLFTGSTGQVVNIFNGSAVFDNYLYLIGPDGTTLASNDDGGGSSDSLIANYRLPTSGTYRIQATSYSSGQVGDYLLRLSLLTPPVCTLIAAPTSVTSYGWSNLTATCSPAATSYVWTGGTCTGQTWSSCSVYPGATTTYTVAGVNAAGTGTPTSATVTLLQPVASLNPASLAFAAQNLNTTSATQLVTLTNTGGAVLNITSIAVSGDFAVTNNCGAGLAAGGTCNLSVTFTPTVAGTRNGAITITSNAAGSPHSVSLSGVGMVIGQTIGTISFTPSTLTVGGTTAASATATSGLTVTFSSTTPTICSVSGSTVTATAAGTCTIAANQAGNATYAAAPQVTQGITVTAAPFNIIDHYYQNILNRPADAGGKAFWQSEATRMSNQGVSNSEAYVVMAKYFFSSPEFLARGFSDDQFVRNLYLTFFNRGADQGGLDYWKSVLTSGLPRDMVMYAFMFSPEFSSFMIQNVGLTYQRAEVGAVVDYYRGAFGRLPDDGGLKYWVNQFRSAQCSGNPTGNVYATAVSIAGSFFGGPDYWAVPPTPSKYDSDLYNAFMRRGADLNGFNYWVSQLSTGAQTYDAVRKSFIDSTEFRARVQAIAGQACTGLMQ